VGVEYVKWFCVRGDYDLDDLRLLPVYRQSYDAENRLTGVSGATSATFVYDGDGNRVKSVLGGVTTYHVGNHFEWTGSTSTMVKYYYAGGQRVAMRKGSSTLYFLLGDHLGSTSLTANSSGSKVAELRYHPYGSTRYTDGTTPTSYRFTGQREDTTIGLYFYNARYYDPALGRFISADTIVPSPGDPQSLNRYSYVLNSPLNYRDPSGHAACLDEECNWVENPATGWISWRGPGEPSLPAGRYLYSEVYGWFDTSHLRTGRPGNVIADVRRAVAASGGPVPIKQLVRGGLTYIGHYQVSSKATPKDAVGTALGMYMDWSMRFELWESTISIFGVNTAFAIEDLPSHYIGFYAAARGISPAEVFANLGFVEGTDQEPPRFTDWPPGNWEIKNFQFTPRVQDDEGNWQNIPWPDAMTITPIGSESGLWEFQSAECQGTFCFITAP